MGKLSEEKKIKKLISILYLFTSQLGANCALLFRKKKKVTEDISYNFVRFHKKNLICFCGIENGLGLGETRYRFLL